LVYSLTSNQSFDEAKKLHEHVFKVKDLTEGIPFVLVGNKADLAEKCREVPTESAEKLAKEWNCSFFEASALTKQNIQESFVALAKETINSKKIEGAVRAIDDTPRSKDKKRRGCTLF